MELNAVTNPVQNAPVIYAATNPTLTGTPAFVTECEDTLNFLGNCYGCVAPPNYGRRPPELSVTSSPSLKDESESEDMISAYAL